MSIEGVINTTLRADVGVGAIAGDRIYPMIAPQSAAFPRITYTVVNTDVDHIFEGASGLLTTRIQIDCRAETYALAKGLSLAVRVALDNLSGSIDGTTVQAIQVESLADIHEPQADGSGVGVFNVALELIAYHE